MAHGENAPLNITPGAIRFNTDSMKLEYFRIGMEGGDTSSYAGIGTVAAGEWVQITTDTPDIQTGGTRGLLMGGYNPSNTYLDEIVYINVDTTGNSLSFGELTVSDRNHVNAGTSDRTRAISAGGNKHPSTYTTDIEFVTIASTGNATDFGGNLTGTARGGAAGASNGTRGIFAGGYYAGPTQVGTIDYITIQSGGDAVDFGDLISVRQQPGSMCSSTRGLFTGGRDHPSYYASINAITMSTLGNAADFGNLTSGRAMPSNGITSNSIRGLTMGGYNGSSYVNPIDYNTIATFGNAVDFGDLSAGRGNGASAASPTRCVMMGGTQPVYQDTIEYVQTMSLGDAVDFGNLNTQATGFGAGASNGHGGLG